MAIYFIPNLDQISVPPLDVDNIPASSEIKEVIKDALSELNSVVATNKADISRALVQLEELKNAPSGDAANIEEIKELISAAKDESIARSVIDDNALKAEILPKIEDVKSLADSKLDISLYDSDKASFATKDELATKLDISLYNSDKASFATKDELNLKADIANLYDFATKDELDNYALKSSISSDGAIVSGASYEQIVATLKYAGLELPKTLVAHQNFNAFGDDRLSGDTTITLTPITYAGSYGQAWERVAIYNEADEMLVAKYATISSDGLSIEAVFSKDAISAHPRNDDYESVPSDYELLDGEVRATITLGEYNYYGATYGNRILNHNSTSYTHSFLAYTHNNKPWSFTFYDYKPSKFSVRNGTETYGGYGHMTKYSLKLQIGDWSKEFIYENSKAVNDIVVDFKDLALGSDEKLIELAKAWNVPVTPYNFYDDVLVAKGVLLSSGLSGQNENFKTNQAAITLSTTKDSIEVSANFDDLLEYPSSNEAQGAGKWIGIGIDTGKPSIIGVSVDDYALQQSDIDEAKAVGLNDGSFVFWLKAEQDYTRELILKSGELERSVSIKFVNKEI
ncbi:hypothetical protein [uncultured Campylobacter sp.]|uniref:hypothetical protein n=1 Tax=uncultured Campylobacter sp. TaxID=218934 RepID=UPI002607F8F8|nr:hypothetical protein [uncultured Campylobacter sp.]